MVTGTVIIAAGIVATTGAGAGAIGVGTTAAVGTAGIGVAITGEPFRRYLIAGQGLR